MRKRVLALAMGLVLFGAAKASAQVVWDAPFLVPPQAQRGMGIYLMDASWNGGMGVVGTWRSGARPQNLGLRIGLAEDWSGDMSGFGGVDLTGHLNRASSDFPLDVDWVFGAGVGIGRFAIMSIPVGLSVGHTFKGDGVSFTPFFTPRLALDAYFGDRVRYWPNRDRLDLNLAADLGLDLAFQPTWKIRFGASFGSWRRDALAIGLVF